jgi:glycerophosphoryl diester phosphodiesterase
MSSKIKRKSFFDAELPIVFAHRGASGYFPENTILAFAEAIESGTNYIETDAHLTKDEIPVLHHDENLKDTTGTDELIGDLRYDEIKNLDAGFNFTPDDGKSFPFREKGIYVPTLDETLRQFKGARFNIDIKDGKKKTAGVVLDVVKKRGAKGRVLIASKSKRALGPVRKKAPDVATGASKGEVIKSLSMSILKRKISNKIPFCALQLPKEIFEFSFLNSRLIEAAKDAGIQVHVWTINYEDDMKRLFDMGVDGIFTDYPEKGIEIAKKYR